jgi:hypothetical protein
MVMMPEYHLKNKASEFRIPFLEGVESLVLISLRYPLIDFRVKYPKKEMIM